MILSFSEEILKWESFNRKRNNVISLIIPCESLEYLSQSQNIGRLSDSKWCIHSHLVRGKKTKVNNNKKVLPKVTLFYFSNDSNDNFRQNPMTTLTQLWFKWCRESLHIYANCLAFPENTFLARWKCYRKNFSTHKFITK